MLRAGAPGSDYMSASEFEDARAVTRVSDNNPSVGSIGATLGVYDDYPRVESFDADGPARRAGVEPGDLLIEIDGQGLRGHSPDEATRRLQGPVGQPLTLTVRRGGEEFRRQVVREHLVNTPLRTRVVDGVGVLRMGALPQPQYLHNALTAFFLANPGLKGAVLDLRGSPGGILDGVVLLADELLDGGEVVEVRQRAPRNTERYNARPGDLLQGRPLVVLIDQYTASGAEIVAAALQDRGRAKIMGLPSFGTGIIQTVVPLRGGRDGALRLLTGLTYRPSGAPLQKLGVTPDLVVAQSQAEADRARSAEGFFSEAQRSPEVNAPGARPRPRPAVVEAPPPGFSGDYQLQRALDLVRTPMR